MDYPAETQEESDKWICDTYVRAVREMCEEDPERAKTFQYGCQALANGQLTDYFLAEMNTLPCEVFASKRYNDTHLYSVTDVTDNNEYLSRLPSKVKMKYMLKADDCIHFTWANADFARELMRNVIDTPLEKEKVLGFTWGTDTYDIIGNEYEIKDEEMNGKAYIQRHWTDLSLISRSAYNPDGMSNEDWEKTFVAKYRETSADVSKKVWEVMNEAAMVFPAFLKQYQLALTLLFLRNYAGLIRPYSVSWISRDLSILTMQIRMETRCLSLSMQERLQMVKLPLKREHR